MKEINSLAQLREEIAELELKQVVAHRELKLQLKITYESLRPANLIKHTLKELTAAPEVKVDFLNSILGIASGFVSKKLIIGNSHNPVKQALGTLLQVGVTNLVIKNGQQIKSVAVRILTAFFIKKNPGESN